MIDEEGSPGLDELLKPLPAGEAMSMIFRDNMKLSFEQVSQETGVPLHELQEIAKGKVNISLKTAEKLAMVFKDTADLLLRMQFVYEVVASGGRMPDDEQVYAIFAGPS